MKIKEILSVPLTAAMLYLKIRLYTFIYEEIMLLEINIVLRYIGLFLLLLVLTAESKILAFSALDWLVKKINMKEA